MDSPLGMESDTEFSRELKLYLNTVDPSVFQMEPEPDLSAFSTATTPSCPDRAQPVSWYPDNPLFDAPKEAPDEALGDIFRRLDDLEAGRGAVTPKTSEMAAMAHIEDLEEELHAMRGQQALALAELQLDKKIAAGIFSVGLVLFLFMCCLGIK